MKALPGAWSKRAHELFLSHPSSADQLWWSSLQGALQLVSEGAAWFLAEWTDSCWQARRQVVCKILDGKFEVMYCTVRKTFAIASYCQFYTLAIVSLVSLSKFRLFWTGCLAHVYLSVFTSICHLKVLNTIKTSHPFKTKLYSTMPDPAEIYLLFWMSLLHF